MNFKTDIELLLEEGIAVKTQDLSEDIVKDLTSSISNGNPAVIWIDCYYEPIRTDMYLKEHWAHMLLVYGFNEQEQTFDILEQKNREALLYERRTISYVDIVSSYNGYLAGLEER